MKNAIKWKQLAEKLKYLDLSDFLQGPCFIAPQIKFSKTPAIKTIRRYLYDSKKGKKICKNEAKPYFYYFQPLFAISDAMLWSRNSRKLLRQ